MGPAYIWTSGYTGGWQSVTLSLGSAFDPCFYVRVRFWFLSDNIIQYEGVYIDYIEFNNRPDTEIYPLEGGFSVLPAPTGVSASDGTYCDKVRVSWSAVSGATSYKVYRSTSNTQCPEPPLASGVTGTQYDDTTATPGTTYYYSVKATNECGDSGCSSTDSGYRKAPPGIPQNVSASDGTYCDKVRVRDRKSVV